MNKLKARREALHLTQKQVADRIGIAQQIYQRYESGKVVPIAPKAVRIAKALETTVEALYGD